MVRLIFLLIIFSMVGCKSQSQKEYEMITSYIKKQNEESAEQLNKAFLCVGTSKTINPKAVKSKYFETYEGGFIVVGNEVGLSVKVDVKKPLTQKIYTKLIIENPSGSNKPYIYENQNNVVDVSQSYIMLTQGPLTGLKIDKTYKVELLAFSDGSRTKKIDRLIQYLRSSIDTMGAKPIIDSSCVRSKEFWWMQSVGR